MHQNGLFDEIKEMKFSALSLDLPHLQIEVALSEFEKLMLSPISIFIYRVTA